jgi:23S rRNA (pseudouridine1915-N3)-methyltransferase
MRLVIAAVGRLKAGPERELCERFVERATAAGRGVGLSPVEVAEVPESNARRPADRMAEEAERLEAVLPKGASRVVLAAKGRNLASEDFAARLAALRDRGPPALAFVIGGPDGLAAPLVRRADLALSFGAATFPHQVVRILLAEQIYRAVTILSGHPYHRP